MTGLLVRVGIDSAFGCWNAPVNTDDWSSVYVPIPEYEDHKQPPGMQTTYRDCEPALNKWTQRGLRFHDGKPTTLPSELSGTHTHLSPDFSCLTYGDTKKWNGKTCPSGIQIARLGEGDFVVFYAGLKPTRKRHDNLEYCLIGQMFVLEVVAHSDIEKKRWHENAKTRSRRAEYKDAVVLRADPNRSGRYSRCIPIGRRRHSISKRTTKPSYRAFPDLLEEWHGLRGGLCGDDGFIERRGTSLPSFGDPDRFLQWLGKKNTDIHHSNW